ncbi:MAG: hypothetical protein OJF49_002601 [Ktedonobacterales bacterium]|jgi:hypothetical protein|nr:MAG: hypothetical protein OJF49_002601 [Ktedonobacterales bacterium]
MLASAPITVEDFNTYFAAMAGAGAALIGLLFVAISINPQRTFGRTAQRERQAVAASAFTALVNGFFVSSAALLPHTNVGAVPLFFGAMGMLTSVMSGTQLVRTELQREASGRRWRSVGRTLFMIVGTTTLYAFQVFTAIQLIEHTNEIGEVYVLSILLMPIYGVALIRAWELIGAPRSGLAGWLNPLRDLDDEEEERAAPAAPAPKPRPQG